MALELSPAHHAVQAPDRVALVMGGAGETITYRELNERSLRLASLLRSRGLGKGDHLAIVAENHPRYFEVAWAALRSGMFLTPVNWHLSPAEASYIVRDCGARCVVTTAGVASVAEGMLAGLAHVPVRLMIDGTSPGYERYEALVAEHPVTPFDDEPQGQFMFYSSGTTGRPKGILVPLTGEPFGTGTPFDQRTRNLFGMDEHAVYLCPAPLYHAAPIGWSLSVQRHGGTVVCMEQFDAADALALVKRYRITHAQFVPTMFVRMLKLPEVERRRHDLSSLRVAVHAAAPCPVPVKEQMIEWWGPILFEYYAGSEGMGMTMITSEDWLAHRGSVGRSTWGVVHIVDDDGEELPAGATGLVYFEPAPGVTPFEYHNDPERTASVFNPRGWSTLRDVGRVDEDGYLYLSDRKDHMIISGGVNIYPQEIEDVLVVLPEVLDAAVIGVPNDEFGEEVKAVIVPADPARAGPELEAVLIAACRERIAHFKCPRSVDFVNELPRLPTGKLLKRVLRERYWSDRVTRI